MTLVELAQYFAEHAASDLRHAQAIARSDLSGHALATAMYLAQQSIEKQLKSIIINMDEKMGLGNSRSIPRLLGHQLYSGLYEFYGKQINDLDTQFLEVSSLQHGAQPAKNVAHMKHFFKQMEKFWASHSKSPSLPSLFWQLSLGIRLKDDDFWRVRSTHVKYAQSMLDILAAAGVNIPPLPNNNYLQRPMLDAIMNSALLASYRGEYARIEINAIESHKLRQTFDTSSAILSLFPNLVQGSFYAGVGLGKNMVFSFGILVLLLAQYQHLALLANHSYGRYPKRLEGGRITTDVYASQANIVLFYLFVAVPYQLGQLRANSGRLDVLLDMGRERGCW